MQKKKLSRREILKVTALAASIDPISVTSSACEEAWVSATPSRAARPSHGQYRAIVPDTLDLTSRAKLAINGLAGTLDWEWKYGPEFYFRTAFAPPVMVHDAVSHAACGPKYFESFPMMRLMTGNDLYADIEGRYRDYMLASLGDDGLFYCKIGPERPWDTTSLGDYADVYGQGRMIRAMLANYFRDHDQEWMKRLAKMVNKLHEIAVYSDDCAYYPTSPGYNGYPKSGWTTADLDRARQQTFRGSNPWYGGTVLALVRYAEAARDERALDLAGKLTRSAIKSDSIWNPDGYAKGITPAEHGHFRGHFHGHTMQLRGALAYAVATNDTELKTFVRDGYEFAREMGIDRLGWFYENTGDLSHETCGLGNMVALGIQLSEAGVGDYWDEVDGYIRNHLVEAQFVNLEKMRSLNPTLSVEQKEMLELFARAKCPGGLSTLSDEQKKILERSTGMLPLPSCFGYLNEKVLERSVGTFAGWGTPVALSSVLMNCCTANGSQALYYAWDSIVRFSQGTASVNLLLNRASPWLDVDSYLPYEGRVVLHNKRAERILVRIPLWVERHALQCEVDGKVRRPVFAGNYLLVDRLPATSTVTVSFPIREETQRFAVDDYGPDGEGPRVLTLTYDIVFRGNTAVKVEEKATHGQTDVTAVPAYEVRPWPVPTYAAYQDREQLRKPPAPMKSVEGVVTDTHIQSW